MQAMILAAGRGTRMSPLTDKTPKPLLKVDNNALLVWHLKNLKKAGFKEIIINIAWLGEQIITALGDGSKWKLNIHYSDERKTGGLETAGGIIKALSLLVGMGKESFLVVNGDVWTDYAFIKKTLKPNTLAHLILVKNPPQHPQGDFALQNDGYVRNQGKTKYTFSGIGYYHPDLFTHLSQGKRPLAPLLRQAMKQNKITGEYYQGEWNDIGTPERLEELNKKIGYPP